MVTYESIARMRNGKKIKKLYKILFSDIAANAALAAKALGEIKEKKAKII